MKTRTESMFWRDFYLSTVPFNCTNQERYEELKRLVESAPRRAYNVKEDVQYKHIVSLGLILGNLNWFLSAQQCVVFGECLMPMTAKEVEETHIKKFAGGMKWRI